VATTTTLSVVVLEMIPLMAVVKMTYSKVVLVTTPLTVGKVMTPSATSVALLELM